MPGPRSPGPPTSMYTDLLEAAFARRPPVASRPSERSAIHAVRHHRGELEEERPSVLDPDAVPTVPAREIGYDVALLELAGVLGIETGPRRFEQPRQERAQLERALCDRGITLRTTPGVRDPAPRRR